MTVESLVGQLTSLPHIDRQLRIEYEAATDGFDRRCSYGGLLFTPHP
jgi:hypothetical protein